MNSQGPAADVLELNGGSSLGVGRWKLGVFSLVLSLDSDTNAADDLVRNGADRRSNLACIDLLPRLAALASHDHDVITRPDIEARDIHHQHVHADRADDWHPFAANQDVAAS